MTIRTASLREIKKLPKTAYKVVVMRYYPYYMKNIKDYIDEWLPILAPSRDLLRLFRHELRRVNNVSLAWRLSKYDSRFRREILRSSGAIKELKRIKDISKKLKGKRVVYLICQEIKDDYCHRRILKELMEMNI